jgi:hypothetical protein
MNSKACKKQTEDIGEWNAQMSKTERRKEHKNKKIGKKKSSLGLRYVFTQNCLQNSPPNKNVAKIKQKRNVIR